MTLRKWLLLSVLLTMLAGCENYSSGDRVLVSKCSYDTGITPPKRYEVVVFKYPEGPMEKNTPKNYIKRLLGLPGELLAIFFGRLYHRVPAENEAPFYHDLQDGAVHANDLWKEEFMHVRDKKAMDWFDEGKFKILRKPTSVMMALRRIVYDNGYQAKDLVGSKLDRWSPAPASTWKSDKATGFVNDGKSVDTVAWMRYRHLLRAEKKEDNDKAEKMLILDTLDYNTLQNEFDRTGDFHQRIYANAHWVGDLMLECNVEVTEPTGEFWLELSRGIDRFRACWDLASGQCTLYRVGKDQKEVKLGESTTTRVKGPGNYMLRLANFDARLTVWVDRDLPFDEGVEYHPPEVRKPNEEISDDDLIKRRGPTDNDLEPASFGSKGASVKVTHIRLWRDTYYRTRIKQGEPDTDYDHSMRREDWCKPERWGELRKQRFTTMYVQPGHYLCLGDNSQSSSDSRVWGLVPERLMLGRALVVYFPLERMGPIR